MSRNCLSKLTLIATLLPLGCSSVDVTSVFKREKPVESGPRNPVVDVICIWEPAEGRGLENEPARGFAGQLLFLTRGSDVPAKVKGDVRVFVFDNQGPDADQEKPLHQFDFDSESFNQYVYKTSFGTAYQLFLPYTRKGSHEAQCDLRVKFTPADGGLPVYSKVAAITLPGAKSSLAAQRWKPEHRQLRSEAGQQKELSARSFPGQPAPSLSRPPTSIPLKTDSRAQQAQSRLARLSADMGDADDTGGIQQASYETEAPAPRRYQLRGSE